jgi:hypothetical protein
MTPHQRIIADGLLAFSKRSMWGCARVQGSVAVSPGAPTAFQRAIEELLMVMPSERQTPAEVDEPIEIVYGQRFRILVYRRGADYLVLNLGDRRDRRTLRRQVQSFFLDVDDRRSKTTL